MTIDPCSATNSGPRADEGLGTGRAGRDLPVDKPVPQPGAAEVLVRIDAVAICATDLEIMRHGVPAKVDGGLPLQ